MSELFNNYAITNTPYEFYSFLRSECPVAFNDDKSVAISRHLDVAKVLSSPHSVKGIEDYVKEPNETILNLRRIREEYFYGLKTFFDIDGEDHEQMRNSVMKYFSKKSVVNYSSFIENRLDNVLKNFSKNDQIDIYKEVFYKIPLDVISQIIGIPEDIHSDLAENVSMVTRLFEPVITDSLSTQIGTAASKISEFLVDAISYKKNSLDQDLLSQLILEKNDLPKILQIVIPLYIAGHITTSYLLSTSLNSLLENKEQKHLYLSDPENPKYSEEMIRYDTPAHIIQRAMQKDLELNSGVIIPEGSLVYLFLGSANRDETVFEDPDVFDLQRHNANKNISFAAGAHFCIGSFLTKLEMTTILSKVLKSFPNIENRMFSTQADVAVKQIDKHIVTL